MFIARSGQLWARFGPAGAELGERAQPAALRLGLSGLGHGDRLSGIAPARPVAWAGRVIYLRPGLSEWFARAPAGGLEQGFLLTRRPSGTGPLVLSVGRVLTRSPPERASSQTISVGGLRYGDLLATDSRGRRLPARLALSGAWLRLVVEDGGASYPVRLDPMARPARRS